MAKLPSGFTKRKNGTLQLAFMYDGKRRYVYGKTVKECKEKEVAERQRLKDKLTGNANITLARYYDEWQQDRKGTVKDSTIYTQNTRFERVRNTLGKKKIVKIERRDIANTQKELTENYSTKSVNDTITLIASVLNSAVNDRIISWNPCNGIKALKRTEAETTDTIHRALTEQEQTLFFQFAHNSYYNNFFRFLILTGCRTGEAAAVTWSDIDRKNNVIHINKTVSRTGNNSFSIDTPKSKSGIRTIPLTEEIKTVLKNQKEITSALHGNIVSFDNRIFSTTDGKGYVVATNLIPVMKKILQKIERDTGTHIEYFSPHAFRDTFATRCIEQGMNPQTLKSLLGHSSLSLTMDKYAQVLENVRQQEMNRIQFAI